MHLVRLDEADLTSANLKRAHLEAAYLVRANLHGADLSFAFLSGADLSEADLTDSILRDGYLGKANFSRAKVNGADFESAWFWRTPVPRSAQALIRADFSSQLARRSRVEPSFVLTRAVPSCSANTPTHRWAAPRVFRRACSTSRAAFAPSACAGAFTCASTRQATKALPGNRRIGPFSEYSVSRNPSP